MVDKFFGSALDTRAYLYGYDSVPYTYLHCTVLVDCRTATCRYRIHSVSKQSRKERKERKEIKVLCTFTHSHCVNLYDHPYQHHYYTRQHKTLQHFYLTAICPIDRYLGHSGARDSKEKKKESSFFHTCYTTHQSGKKQRGKKRAEFFSCFFCLFSFFFSFSLAEVSVRYLSKVSKPLQRK